MIRIETLTWLLSSPKFKSSPFLSSNTYLYSKTRSNVLSQLRNSSRFSLPSNFGMSKLKSFELLVDLL